MFVTLMYRALILGNLSQNIATFYIFLILMNLEKNVLLSS